MGTNYYIGKKDLFSGTVEKIIHIGKASYGWVFSLHITNELPDFQSWQKRLRTLKLGEYIFNEYNEQISYFSLMDIIKERQGTKRYKIGDECIKHEEYCDLIAGDFC